MRTVTPIGGRAGWQPPSGALDGATVQFGALAPEVRRDLEALAAATPDVATARRGGAWPMPATSATEAQRGGASTAAPGGGAAFASFVGERVLAGSGVLVLRGLPFEPGDPERCEAALVAMLAAFGEVLDQNTRGDPVYTVVDRGDPKGFYGGSRATDRLLPHTDQAAAPEDRLAEVMALWCLHPALEGGDTVLASGHALHDRLVAESPELAASLYRDLPFGRDADGVSAAPPVRSPVFRRVGGEVRVRYNDYFVRRGIEQTGVAPATDQQEALAYCEELLGSGELDEVVPLERGDLLLVDNRVVLHDRRAYRDDPDPARKRRLLRGWARRS